MLDDSCEGLSPLQAPSSSRSGNEFHCLLDSNLSNTSVSIIVDAASSAELSDKVRYGSMAFMYASDKKRQLVKPSETVSDEI